MSDPRAVPTEAEPGGHDTLREADAAIGRLIELTNVLARRTAQLQGALDSRIVIEQAKGILAERFGTDVDTAFVMLRRSARSNRMNIHKLATRVVESSGTPYELVSPSRR